jgi:hypothetical protein
MAMVCQWFGLKTTRTVFSGLTSKLVAMVSSSLASKPTMTVSGGLASKPAMMVFWFGPQNQAGYGLSVTSQNQQEGVGVGHASRSSDLLHMEASQGRVSQPGLKTGRGAIADGARGTITEVTSEAS